MKKNHITIILKVTRRCNFKCPYCNEYLNDDTMSFETLDEIFKKTSNSFNAITCIFHGGEPLILGLNFYKKALQLQSKYSNTVFFNSIQSNISLLTEEMMLYFANHGITISSSHDGYTNEESRGNTQIIEDKLRLIKKYQDNVSVVSVINSKNICHLVDSYNIFKKLGVNVNFNTDFYDYSMDFNIWKENMYQLYHACKDDKTIIVDPFYELETKKFYCEHSVCVGKFFSFACNGDIYPCGRFQVDYKLGNISEIKTLTDILSSENFNLYLTNTFNRISKCKAECELFEYCKGNCNYRAHTENNMNTNRGRYCDELNFLINIILDNCKKV